MSPLSPRSPLRAERLTATGGELVVGMANSLVWQFAGPDDYTSTTLLDFSLIQPLLRRGGRTRVLERLTISERALLALAQGDYEQAQRHVEAALKLDKDSLPARWTQAELLRTSG